MWVDEKWNIKKTVDLIHHTAPSSHKNAWKEEQRSKEIQDT